MSKPQGTFWTLPSVFHIEILLMAFHLSSEGEKATLANLIFSSLRTIDAPADGFNSTQLSCWAILVSRLILVLRHMIFYPRACPSSLLLDLRSKLREAPLAGSNPSVNTSDNSSWASIAVENIMGAWIKEDPFLSSLVNQLSDVASLPASLCRMILPSQSLCLHWDDICASFSWILGSGKARKLQPWKTLFLKGHSGVIGEGISFLDVVIGVLQHLHAVHITDDIEDLGWDFLRNGMWLSLVLSLLQTGIGEYCLKNSVPGMGPISPEYASSDNEYLTLAEGLISSLLEAGQVAKVSRILSSFLNRYLQAYQKAFLSTIDNGQYHGDRFSPLLLLKHTGVDKCMQDGLLEKSGINPCHLRFPFSSSSFQWNSSFMHSKHKRDHLHSRGAAENQGCEGNILMETEVLQEILDSVMTIKCDRIFESLHGNCEAIYHSLSAGMEGSDFSYLFQMKQMEGFLRDINAGEEDPSLAVIFKFYVSMVDVSEKVEELYGLQRDLCPDLKQKIQTKFLSMDLLCLSKWLEKRLVGCAVDASEGVSCAKASSTALRESTMNFIYALGIPDEATFKEDCSIDGKAGWSNKNTLEKSPGKPFSSGSIGVGPVASRPVGSRKNSETFVLSANQETGSASLECDATSVDEDEDDGTSDGEVASMDKDEEDDSNSERALASKYAHLHPVAAILWNNTGIFVYTCDLTVSKGCCSVCAKVCHRDHRVVYSRSSRFFCDCGAGVSESFLPFTEDGDQLPDSDSDLDEDGCTDVDNSVSLSISRELQDGMPVLLEELDVEGQCQYSRSTCCWGSDKVAIFDVGHLIGQPPLHLPRGEVTDRLAIELALQGAYIRRIDWVPDATLLVASQGRVFLIVLSELGSLYRLELSLEGRLNPNATSLTEISAVYEDEQDGKLRPAGLHRWKELLNMRHAVGSTSPLVGITAYKPLSKDKIHCLVLHDDGSLQIYSHVPMGVDADVKWVGDAVRNGDSEGAKHSLVSEDGFLESPSPAGFKVGIGNPVPLWLWSWCWCADCSYLLVLLVEMLLSGDNCCQFNPDIVMVGFRVHVGNTSASHIPSDITIFQRVIKLDDGMRSWIWEKCRSMQSAPIQEQVVADGLKLLSRNIFESDREPLLQAAACCVLQAVKDTMRLLGVVKSTSVLSSRLGVGGTTAGWILKSLQPDACSL
ncbi:Auxin transport protein BIG [Vitis vinifera]|uniref:Auxin transport protein BIG n=1 Tax=Vitis vinifera TaxID=29760 RepID=A0A438IMY9_VITVI|nr:Auxin transport protein BIG [Vitis vinifera]